MGEIRESALDRLARSSGGLFTVGQAADDGWTAAAVRLAAVAGELVRLRQGVYTSRRIWERADPIRRERLVMVAHQRMNPRLVGVGLSAAAALGLPLPADRARPASAMWTPSLRPRRPGERVLRLRGGPALTTVDQVVIDCARVLPIEWGLAVADAAVFTGLVDLGDLQPADKVLPVEGLNGPRGIRQARWVLDHVKAKVESPLESLARAIIVLGGFPEPEPQQWIGTRRGRFRVDLLDEVSRVIVEADGKVKYTDDDKGEALWKEKGREDALRDEDYEVVRFTMADFYARASFWDRYEAALTRATRFRH